jgi:hypothetical protein
MKTPPKVTAEWSRGAPVPGRSNINKLAGLAPPNPHAPSRMESQLSNVES